MQKYPPSCVTGEGLTNRKLVIPNQYKYGVTVY